jgi:small-conductance mechanosensitive channel
MRLVRTVIAVAPLIGAALYAAGAPVVFDGKTLFTIDAPVASFSPLDRARTIGGRLQSLSKSPLVKTGSFTISQGETATDIDAGDLVVMSVTAADAQAAGQPRQALAARYAAVMAAALVDSRQEHSLKEILIDAGLAVLATAFLFLVLKLLQAGFLALRRKIESWRGTRIRSIRIQRLELLPAERIVWALAAFSRIFQAAVVLVLLYLYVSSVLSFFPVTRGLSAALFGYVKSGLGVVATQVAVVFPNIVMIAVIVVVTRYVIKFCHFIFRAVERGSLTIGGFYREWAEPTYKIVRLFILAFACVVIFPYVPGHESPAFKGLSIFLGLLVSLGSAGAVSNVIAGVLLTYTRAFQLGDRVKIADTTGDIMEKTLLATRVRTIKNEDVTVPNSLVLGSHIINYSSCCRNSALILHTQITIGYDAPWRKVHELLTSAALATSGILREPPPFVLQTALNDFYVTYQINAYTNEPSRMVVIYGELHQNIQDKFNEAGVEICSPHFASLRDGNRIAIPGDYVAADYSAPAFRVSQAENGAAAVRGASANVPPGT